ncbi:MAG: uracil-DNA glycosylase [Brevundimonas sp.]|nr:MAG: uracil-DNA glycosylase [Brevundimonas sp.]
MQTLPSDRALESLLAFWSDAGVDACYLDAPVDRTQMAPPPVVKAIARATASVAPPPGAANPDAIAEARALAAAADSLETLEAAIAGFRACPLVGMGASRAVFARGNPKAPILVIGEAPGADEDAQGKPFVGEAGRLLDRMLAAGGLTDQVFITNTVYWRPPGNRTPTSQEQAICQPFLERVLTLLRPKLVLLVGAAANKAVLQSDEGVMKVRGQWREWRLAEGGVSAPAMATLHPAFLLRQPQFKRQAWQDILSLADRLTAG